MNPESPKRWAQIEDLFHRAAECDPEQRAALLDHACNGDTQLRREVEGLLVSDQSAREDMHAAVHNGIDAVAFPLVGETISHYRILDGLGGGGMGLVYRAEDIKLGRQVALKFLPEESVQNPDALRRFEREARSASALEHPNICPIYEFGEHEGQPFLVMQLLEGQTLRELISSSEPPGKTPLDVPKLLDLALQITEGLDAAHRYGIIHRDIKPANIFVTSQGQAKILDFGLAKLSRGDVVGEESRWDSLGTINEEAAMDVTAMRVAPDPLLSRTGLAMGTAGYMSPEQARGEKLDSRTDLFSFGLVLYEMATGRRALPRDTGARVPDSILNYQPEPARRLNPQVPAGLEAIIGKALEKDRKARYQSASELRIDLQQLKHNTEPRNRLRSWIPASGAVVLMLLIGVFYWFAKRQPSSTPAPPEIKFRQLTINSSENPITSETISHDGKLLAYVDTLGVHVRDIETGAHQVVAPPQGMKRDSITWEVIDSGWFPDNAHFAVSAHPATEDSGAWSSRTASIWVFSRTGEAPRKLRDHAVVWSVSPDGALIAFGTNAGRLGERETWIMDSDGRHARMLFDTDENSSTGGFLWSSVGKRGIYFKSDTSGDTLLSRDISGGTPVTVLTSAEMPKQIRGDASWLPDGRLIYQVTEVGSGATPDEDTCNFWELRVDVHTGKLVGKPRRLTNWTGFCIAGANATADGKRIAFLRNATQFTVYVADLEEAGTRVVNVRHFTLDESWNMLQDWTNDSKNIVFTSNRAGHFEVYKESLESDEPELISTGRDSFRDTQETPDGKWLLGIPWPQAPDSKESTGLVRIPLDGGAPEFLTTTLQDAIFCARPPASLCVLGERTEDRKQVIFTSVDPVNGRGRELARFDLDPASSYWDFEISPDGRRVAVSRNTQGPIHLLSLKGAPEQVIRAKFNDSQEFHWAADGRGLYVPDQTKRGTVLLHVDLRGKTQVLWEQRGGGWIWARPSPDGRHLAIESSANSNNVWMMENF